MHGPRHSGMQLLYTSCTRAERRGTCYVPHSSAEVVAAFSASGPEQDGGVARRHSLYYALRRYVHDTWRKRRLLTGERKGATGSGKTYALVGQHTVQQRLHCRDKIEFRDWRPGHAGSRWKHSPNGVTYNFLEAQFRAEGGRRCD